MNRKDAKNAKEKRECAERRSREVIGAAIEVHRTLGPGLLESVYENAMAVELSILGVPYRRQVAIPLRYKSVSLGAALKVDLIVDERIVVELKSTKALLPVHDAQVLTYLKLTGISLGLLFNFNTTPLRKGIRRLVHKH